MVQRLLWHHILLARAFPNQHHSESFQRCPATSSLAHQWPHFMVQRCTGILTVCMSSKFSSIFKQFKLCFEVSWYGRHVLIRCFPSANLLKAWLAWRRQEAPVKGPCSPPRRPSIKAMYSLCTLWEPHANRLIRWEKNYRWSRILIKWNQMRQVAVLSHKMFEGSPRLPKDLHTARVRVQSMANTTLSGFETRGHFHPA